MSLIIHKITKIRIKKIQIFDVVVIFTILIVLGIFLFNRFSKKTVWINAKISISDSDIWWKGEDPPYWYLEDLESGMISYNSFGEEVAELLSVHSFPNGGLYDFSYVNVKLKVSYDKKRQVYLFNFRPLQKGKPIDLTFGSNNISGVISSIDSEPKPLIPKKIKVLQKFMEPWHAAEFKVGMELVDSNNNQVYAKIESVEIENSKLKPIVSIDDSFYFDNNLKKDVTLTLTILTEKDNRGTYHFVDGSAVKIGDTIWFHFPTVISSGRIIEIIE